MAVLRITPNLTAADPPAMAAFWQKVLGLDPVMDVGWIVTLAGPDQHVQLSLASDGGAGNPVPSVSIEVDDLDACHARAVAAGAAISHGSVTESWGVRRFLMHDPAGNLVNILSHC